MFSKLSKIKYQKSLERVGLKIINQKKIPNFEIKTNKSRVTTKETND